MIEVTFKCPDELELAFFYLDQQFKRFIDENIILPHHKISFSKNEIIILMWYEDDNDEDDDNDGGDDDPIWPIVEPDPPLAFEITGYLPKFIST
jgi:hypothetical protein